MATIAKRTTGDGSPRYDVRYRVAGKQAKKSFRRRSDAETFRRQVEADELVGVVVDPKAGITTLAAYAESWITTRVVRGRPLTAATVEGYRGLLRRNVLPDLGHLQLRAILPATVRTWHGVVTERAGADQAGEELPDPAGHPRDGGGRRPHPVEPLSDPGWRAGAGHRTADGGLVAGA